MARNRPRTVIFYYRGEPWELDLAKCRRALVQRQVEGELHDMLQLAKAIDHSRSTASRFFSGRGTSLAVTLKVLDALHLEWDDVARPVYLPPPDGSL